MEGTLVLEKVPEKAITWPEMGWDKQPGLPYWRSGWEGGLRPPMHDEEFGLHPISDV